MRSATYQEQAEVVKLKRKNKTKQTTTTKNTKRQKTATYQEQAEVVENVPVCVIEKSDQVHFRHEALMLVELSNGAQLGWSTLPGLTSLLGEGVGYFHRRNIYVS